MLSLTPAIVQYGVKEYIYVQIIKPYSKQNLPHIHPDVLSLYLIKI